MIDVKPKAYKHKGKRKRKRKKKRGIKCIFENKTYQPLSPNRRGKITESAKKKKKK